jgi:hypothetical protein
LFGFFDFAVHPCRPHLQLIPSLAGYTPIQIHSLVSSCQAAQFEFQILHFASPFNQQP